MALAALVAGLIPLAPASNAEEPPREAVLDRVQALEQELALLKRKLEVQEETAALKPPSPGRARHIC